MYPKNAASPEPIAIGAVVQISDGAVQTSGCTVRIKPIGVSEGDGAGTTAYSTDGIVLYTPTQAETNYTSFILIAKKTGCIPVSITVVTTSSATPGTVLLAPVTHTSAVVPTVTTVTTTTTATNLTNLPTIPANWITAAGINASAFTAEKFDTACLTSAKFDTGAITSTVVADGFITSAKFAAGAINNAAIATDAIGSDELASSAITEIQSGLASQTSVDDVPTNAELAAAITTALTTALTEGYRATNATGSVRDLLYEILQNITEFTISSTTKTVKKLDGSTTAKTYTLNDGTTPTGITEAT